MAITGNKGEWSEIYALFKLLGEGRVYAGDAFMHRTNVFYPILDIIRTEEKRYEYRPWSCSDGRSVVVEENGTEILRIPMGRFLEQSRFLLNAIRHQHARSFAVEPVEAFMTEIKCRKLKAGTGNKSDIRIVIHDARTGMTPELGFSIKSRLGGSATLLNASRATNIIYRIEGARFNDAEAAAVNVIKGQTDRIRAITEKGGRLAYAGFANRIFHDNLMFIDTALPQIVAACVKAHFESSCNAIRDVVGKIAENDPLALAVPETESFYAHKIKMMLIDAALGMMPSKRWNGRYDANGGYLIVRDDGEIVCYHFYNRNDVEDYLYSNTRFERADRGKHEYGTLYNEPDGNTYMKLNLQIRFF